MKKFLLASLVLSSLSPLALMAQVDLDDEIDAELSRIYSGGSNKGVKDLSGQNDMNANNQGGPSIQINVQSSPQVTSNSDAITKAESKNESKVDNKIEESELQVQGDATGLNQLKSSRKQLEVQNELKIVEKLESSRLEDEKSRTERLFGNKSVEAVDSANVAKDVIIEKVIITESKPKSDDTLDREAVRAEIRETLSAKKLEEEFDNSDIGETYFSGLVGLGDYQGIANVRGTYSLGFAIGQKASKSLTVEGAFLFSEFDVEQRDGGYVCDYFYGCTQYPRITRMNQYQGNVTAKYTPFEGAFRPYLGGSVAYTYRTFSDVQFAIPNNDAQSHALDLGLVAGVDLVVTPDFSIGFDLRAFTNVTSRATNSGLQKSFARSVYNSDTPIESLDYTQMGITGKFQF